MENNKFYIVSESALDEFVCCKCYNYLTVTPIGVINGEFVCGRCPQENMDINPNIDEQDFSKKLFRCVNRFDGCRKLLRYSEVKKHEKECFSKVNVCCCFLCLFTGNLCQIYNHVKRQHSDSFSNSPSFLFYSNGLEILRLFRYKDFLTLIITKIKRKRLFLKVINYGKKNEMNPLHYQIILRNLEENVLHEFPKKICYVENKMKYTFTAGDDSIEVFEFMKFFRQGILRCEIKFIEQFSSLCFIDFPDLTISPPSKAKPEEVLDSKEELKEKNASGTEGSSSSHLELISSSTQTEESHITTNSMRCGNWYERRGRRYISGRGRRNMLVRTETKKGKFLDSIRDTFFKCSNCEIFVCNTNYLCQLNHIKCEECISDFCSKCNEISNYKPVTDGRDLLLTETELPCRFNEMHLYEPESLRKHEYSCPDRLFSCPLLCGWEGKLKDLWQHWHSTTTPLLENSCEVDSFKKGNNVFYVLYESDCFCCQILEDKYHQDQKYIHIRHSWALCSNVSQSCAVVKLKIFSHEEYETVSCKIFKLGEIKSIKLPLNTYYKIKIEFEGFEPEGLTYM